MLIYETQPGLIRRRNAADAAFRAAHPDDPKNVAKAGSKWRCRWFEVIGSA